MSYYEAVGMLRDEIMNISLGRVSGMSSYVKFGANVSVGTTRQDIWSVGGIYPWPKNVAETVRIKAGGDPADTADGDGARSVIIYGLDENWNVASEVVVSAGADASTPTATRFFRVYRVKPTGVGVYTGRNVGAIRIENTVSENVLAEVQAGYGQTQMTHFTVAAGKRALMFAPFITVDANQPSNVRLCIRENADIFSAPYSPVTTALEVDAFSGPTNINETFPTLLPGKTDIWADAEAAASTASINIRFVLMLIED